MLGIKTDGVSDRQNVTWKTNREKQMGERLTTGEICTRSVTIAFRRTTVNGAARLMRENHVGCLIVVEETGGMRIVVGVLTDRDIVTSVVAADLDPSALLVEDVMSTDLVTAREEDSLIDLMHTMRREGVRRVPVVGGQGELVGVATLDDVLDILAEELGLLVGAIDSEGKRERQVRK
jgi:CBS domain-containing protein